MKYIKENRNKLIGILVVLVVLAAAFWYGNGTEESRGFAVGRNADKNVQTIQDNQVQTEVVTTESQYTHNEQTEPVSQEENPENIGQTTNAEQTTQTDEQGELENYEELNNSQQTEQETTNSNQEIEQETTNQNQQTEPETAARTYSCTISISCANILDNMDKLKENKKGLVPLDGWILKPVTVEVTQGETVFDVLKRVCMDRKIHMEASFSPVYQTSYVEGINNLYQFDCGGLSGWMYKVNGDVAGVGADGYVLKDKDVIEWKYTCKMGDI